MTPPTDQGSSEALRALAACNALHHPDGHTVVVGFQAWCSSCQARLKVVEAAFTLGRQQQARDDAQRACEEIAAALRSSRAPQEPE